MGCLDGSVGGLVDGDVRYFAYIYSLREHELIK
jgi:hypothetical protein